MSTRRELDPEWQARVDEVTRDLPKWISWIGTLQKPEPGSQLEDDDRLGPGSIVSQMAWQGLIAATDHLDLLNESLIHSGVRPTAQFTLARGALFAGARTVWILAPDEQKTRRRRALFVAYEDYRNLRKDGEALLASPLSKRYDSDTKKRLKEQVATPVDDVKAAGLQIGLKLGASKNCDKVPTDTAIVAYAAGQIDPEGSGSGAALEHQWRAHSGHAHGLSWPQLLNTPELETAEDGTVFRRVAGDEMSMALALTGAWLLINRGFGLYWSRSKPAP
ncbi:hypothetical protein [Nocardia cyriacigeorgica]|uniref:hypothetical protein n=1 Tax=Nocardia cyriacigeorgica TaxID=135487 RepID=UPI003511C70A